MKLAIISVTNQGALLSQELAKKLTLCGKTADLFAKEGRNPVGAVSYNLLSRLVGDIFSKYDGFLFIMAAGIVVRVIAPYVCDKRVDPAVVVMGDNGKHVISLLAGHMGGANELTQSLAALSGAEPVITTATDLARKPAADMLAVKLKLTIEPFARLKTINAAIVANDNVKFFLDTSLDNQEAYYQEAARQGIILEELSQLAVANYDAAVIITDQLLPDHHRHLYLRPRTLSVGIGCRRDTRSEEILQAVANACEKAGRSIGSIAIIGSSVVKQEEKGLLEVIGQLAVESRFFPNEPLQACIEKYQLEESEFVKKEIGVGNVCAAAAIIAGQSDKLLLPKTKYKNVTVAIATAKSR